MLLLEGQGFEVHSDEEDKKVWFVCTHDDDPCFPMTLLQLKTLGERVVQTFTERKPDVRFIGRRDVC